MRIIILLIIFILSSCQNQNPPATQQQQQVKTQAQKSKNTSAAYDRYKYKNNRYTIKQDKAPKSNKKVNLKEPVPAHEAMSRYGNPSEYKVDGRKYQILANPAGYKTRGVASWYGQKFHNQRTSSGEPYDMYVMTAAHRTLPLPTYIKVKNLDNGKSAVVKVNDRGPFHGDRVIDLSYAAALKLGVFPKGTAHVEIETLKGPAGQAHYYLQAGAFSSEALAKQLQTKLAKISTSPVFVERYQSRYIVRVGPFASKNMADALKLKLSHNGVYGAFSVLV